jgi:mono/diheme cytochrome c family protein
MLKMSAAQLVAATKEGKGKMPAYSGKLTGAQINQVVAYIQTLQKK